MSTFVGIGTAILEIVCAILLVRWARLQEYESTAEKLNWPAAAVDLLNRRKWRSLWGFVVASACVVAVWRIAGPSTNSERHTLGSLVAAAGAAALPCGFVVSLWWMRRWRRHPGWPPLPR